MIFFFVLCEFVLMHMVINWKNQHHS